MILEALAALTLHCTADIRDNPGAPKVNLTMTVDYDRGYAYMTGGGGLFDGPIEITGLRVTPGKIAFPVRDHQGYIMTFGEVSRTNGELTMHWESPFYPGKDYRYIDGTCRPGDPVPVPQSIF